MAAQENITLGAPERLKLAALAAAQRKHSLHNFSLVEFAERKSNGAWIGYRWCRYVAERIETALKNGRVRLILNVPPQHGKSELVSHWLPAWFLHRDPTKRVILASYGADKAVEYAWKVLGHAAAGDLSFGVARGRGERDNWTTADKLTGQPLEGGMKGVGIGGAIVGYGGHLQILDDPIKNWQEAHSRAWMEHFKGWWGSTFMTRLQQDGSVVVIQHRWTENDPTAWLLSEYPGAWNVISLPALAQDGDPLGRAVDEPLCPERFDYEALCGQRRDVGPYTWDGQYQQNPRPIGGTIVGRDQFQYWTERPATFDVVIQSWDFATNKKPGSWVVGQVWGKRGSEYWLLDQTRGRWSFIESRQAVLSLSAKWPEAVAKVIEAKANGPAIMSDLGGLIDGLTPWPPPGMAMSDKQTRFLGVSPLIVAGNVFVPTPSVAPWIHDYLEELTAFPGEPNDQVDTTSQALQYLRDVKPKAPFVMRGGWK